MSDKMREEFDLWIDSLTFEQLDNIDENSAWQAWQASRSALVVELPPAAISDSSVEILYTEDVCNGLDNVGVAYK